MGAGYAYERVAPPPRCRRLRAALDRYVPALRCLLIVAILLGGVLSLVWWIGLRPAYSVAIPSASGLDYRAFAAASGQPTALLRPLFNLTVGIASQSRHQACLSPTTSVQVEYMGVLLASGIVPPGLCAAPYRSQELRVLARGEAVAMSPFLMDTLAEDVRNGDALFKVRFMSPHGDYWEVYKCVAKIGKPAAECDGPYDARP